MAGCLEAVQRGEVDIVFGFIRQSGAVFNFVEEREGIFLGDDGGCDIVPPLLSCCFDEESYGFVAIQFERSLCFWFFCRFHGFLALCVMVM
jgi:hypothetical protein